MEVVVVGSCNTDLISYVPNLPRPGETVHGTRFRSGCGGKGANQCVMAARLGASIAMVAKVGDDQFGRDAITNFKNNNVNVDHVTVTSEAHSGVAPITVDDRGENSIIIVSGANMKLSPSDVQKAHDIVLGAKVVVCQLEVPPDTSLEALRLARENGVLTIFNTAPAITLSNEFFKYTDILVLNETEAEILDGSPVTDVNTAKEVVGRLLARGTGAVVLTLGGGGVVFSDWGSMEASKIIHIPAETVSTVDTTGAGDAFVGAMAYYLSRERQMSFSEVMRRSGIIASYTTTLPGTQTSYQVHNLPSDLIHTQ